MGLLEKCPFCGEVPDTSHPMFMWCEATSSWVLNHYCQKDGEATGSIMVCGKTAEEVFERWNDRIKEG